MFENTRYETNKKALLSSQIIAKAVIRRQTGYEIVVVFQQSTLHEFYWTFRARSPRSPRRSWKLSGYFKRDLQSVRDVRAYVDFGSFVSHYAQTHGAQVVSVRVLHVRRMADLLACTMQESLHADWTPRGPATNDDVRYVDKRMARARAGRNAWMLNE